MLRKLRIGSGCFFLAITILIPFLSYLNTLRQVYGIKGFHIANLAGGWLVGKLYAMYELTFGRLEDPVSVVDSFHGVFWSISIAGVKIADPLAGLGHALATKQLYAPLLLSLSIPVIFTLVFGRAFCGWICPVNTITQAADGLRNILTPRSPWINDINLGHGTKHWILLATLILITITGIPFFAYYLPYLILGREIYNFFFFQTVGAGAMFFIGLILFEIFISRRGWCRYLCPAGAMLSLLGSFSLVKLASKTGIACPETCNECEKTCPMGLMIKDSEPGSECSNCGECAIACQQDKLGFTLRFRKTSFLAFILSIPLGAILITPAGAHHISGIPHYGYAENYPQVPLNEQKAEAGDYSVSMTTIFFQGIRQELSGIPYDTQFYVHIRKSMPDEMLPQKEFVNPFDHDARKKADANIVKDASYRDKLRLIILDGKDKKIASYTLDRPSEEAVYRFRHYFVHPGDYTIHTEFFPLGERSVIKFPVTIEAPGGVSWMIISGIGAIIIFSLFLLFKKRKLRAGL